MGDHPAHTSFLQALKIHLSNPRSGQEVAYALGAASTSLVERTIECWLLGTMGKLPSMWMERHWSPTFIWNLSVCEDFIEQNPIGPDIRFEGVGAVVGCLRGCPFHRDLSAATGGINVILQSNQR